MQEKTLFRAFFLESYPKSSEAFGPRGRQDFRIRRKGLVKKVSSQSPFSLFRYLKPYRVQCVVGPLFKLAEAVLELYMPFLLAQVIDRGIATGDYAYVRRMAFVLVGIVTAGLGMALVCQYLASKTSQGFGTTLRNELFGKIMSLSHGDTDRFGAPTLVNRLTNDVNQLQFVVAMLIRLVIRAPFLCVGGIIMAFVLDWRLALIMKKSVPLYKRVQTHFDGMSRIIRENMSGVRVIRAFGKTREENARFGGELDEFTAASVRVAKVSILLNPITQLIMNAAILLILTVTGVTAHNGGDVSTGTIVALINYANQILAALIVVSSLVVTFTKAYASATRVAEVLCVETSIVGGSLTYAPSDAGPQIAFRNVFFTYGDGEDELEDVSFTVERGETVGIIGTTLINLLMRFYDARSGEIRINGRDIREYDLTSLRGAIAAVPQKVQLFSGSIEQNLRWGRPDATDEQVVRAARAAQADGFISAKPEGYRAQIERGGVNFSGGQRQRLAIARALVRDFDILILDDSSSALDYSTDAAIRSAIRREYAGKTLIVVSQRVNSIMDADKILVLDNGRIVGEGTHESLLRTCDFYREICASQQIKGGAEQ